MYLYLKRSAAQYIYIRRIHVKVAKIGFDVSDSYDWLEHDMWRHNVVGHFECKIELELLLLSCLIFYAEQPPSKDSTLFKSPVKSAKEFTN